MQRKFDPLLFNKEEKNLSQLLLTCQKYSPFLLHKNVLKHHIIPQVLDPFYYFGLKLKLTKKTTQAKIDINYINTLLDFIFNSDQNENVRWDNVKENLFDNHLAMHYEGINKIKIFSNKVDAREYLVKNNAINFTTDNKSVAILIGITFGEKESSLIDSIRKGLQHNNPINLITIKNKMLLAQRTFNNIQIREIDVPSLTIKKDDFLDNYVAKDLKAFLHENAFETIKNKRALDGENNNLTNKKNKR